MRSHPRIQESAPETTAPRLTLVRDDEPRRSHPCPEWCDAYDRMRIGRRRASMREVTALPPRRTRYQRLRDAGQLIAQRRKAQA